MPVTYSDAHDELLGILNGAWQQLAAIVGYIPVIQWPGAAVAAQPPLDQIWARASYQIVTDSQASFSNQNSERKYRAKGLFYVQVFCPRTEADKQLGIQLSQFVREFYRKESPSGELWFTNARIIELAATDQNYPINIVVNYEYENIGGQANLGAFVPQLIARGKHFPVEPIDGIRTVFTFPGLPADPNFYLLILNGVVQDGLIQNGETIDFGVGNAPKPATAENGFRGDIVYALF